MSTNNVYELDTRLRRIERVDTPGGGGDNGDMEARIAKLESSMDYVQRDIGELKTDVRELRNDLRTDFRVIFGAVITVALGLASLMAKGFGWL